MKGGITSGVIYPLALVELSRAFRLKNIGGTSAGAIAAAAAAAAELGRGKPGAGFERLALLPMELSEITGERGRSRLFGFFQPQSDTKPLFDIGIAFLEGGKRAWWRVPMAAASAVPGWFLSGALPGLLLGWLAWQHPGIYACIAGVVISLIIAIAGVLVLAAFGVARLANRRLAAHNYGLCSGMDGADSKKPQKPLTVWLTQYLEEVAGRPASDSPLTFGDLWQLQRGSNERVINLEMMTTCLTHGRPYRLPLRQDDVLNENAQFYFRADEFRALFPKHVVDWMLDYPRPVSATDTDAERRERFKLAGFYPLPSPANLPVVVATRMSLSFPLLLCAVPLHAVDFTQGERDTRLPERCWFSDGGICSNFPVHFFDSPLPRWPTFGIDLVEPHPTRPEPVWMPKRNNEGMRERWKRFEGDRGPGAVARFLFCILNTAMEWTDNTQARLPGFRDRIAAISLSPEEGGLNLNMPPELIQKLSNLGKLAGEQFVARFTSTPEGIDLTWPNHRRVRLRSTLAAIEEMVISLEKAIASPVAPDESYDTGVMLDKSSYNWVPVAQLRHAQATLQTLRQLGRQLATASADEILQTGSPKPYPQLRERTRI